MAEPGAGRTEAESPRPEAPRGPGQCGESWGHSGGVHLCYRSWDPRGAEEEDTAPPAAGEARQGGLCVLRSVHLPILNPLQKRPACIWSHSSAGIFAQSAASHPHPERHWVPTSTWGGWSCSARNPCGHKVAAHKAKATGYLCPQHWAPRTPPHSKAGEQSLLQACPQGPGGSPTSLTPRV